MSFLWVIDPARNQYYYYDPNRRSYVYADGSEVAVPSLPM